MHELQPSKENDNQYIVNKLVQYNLSQVQPLQKEHFIDLSTKIIEEDGSIIGGIAAKMYCWNCVYIDALWVSDSRRGEGLGKKLIQEVEECAKIKGAYLVHLDTFDFQAKEFYEKQGYKIFGVLDDCPSGHKRYYMEKRL